MPPFRPACYTEACGTQCGGMVPLPCGRLSGLRPLEPPASALLRRDKPDTETKWRCRCTTAGATRPLRARHRRASPRVLENAQGCSAQQLRHALPKFPKHIALTAPCANRPTSPTSPTSPTFFARTLCIAPCTLPAIFSLFFTKSLEKYSLIRYNILWVTVNLL